MKNPFVAVAALMAMMTAAMKENAYRDTFGHAPKTRTKSRIPGKPGIAGAKLARKALECKIAIRHP